MNFIKRKILPHISNFLNYKEAIVIYGARQVGKTTIMKMLINELKSTNKIPEEAVFYFDLEDLELLELCNQGVDHLIRYINARTSYNSNSSPAPSNSQGKIYLFIDEIQYLNNASSFIKLMVDNHSNRFKLIVSGSSVLDIKSKIKQSLVGRIVTFEVLGLDFEEFLWFEKKKYHLDKVADTDKKTQKELKQLFEEFIIFGAYPRVALISNLNNRRYYLKELIQTYIKKDIRDIGKIRNIMKFNNFLRILADQAGNLLNIDELASSIGIARETVYDYFILLEGTYIARRLAPFFKNLRSELTKMPKIYFEDTGILNYLKYNDIVEKVGGELFENCIYAELRKTVGLETLRYWRTQSKQEIDFVIQHQKQVFTLEVKKIYSGQKTTSLEYFSQKYPNSKSFIITLEKRREAKGNISLLYPWEIHNKLRAEQLKKD
ncbi:ATP-binding protein [bacterium]|nr:ATP-binding protein [bacterium]